MTIEDKTVPFGKDDALVLYTDGVTESVNDTGEEYTGDRLKENLLKYGSNSAQSILNHIMESIRSFSGNAGQPDDFTLIAVKHN